MESEIQNGGAKEKIKVKSINKAKKKENKTLTKEKTKTSDTLKSKTNREEMKVNNKEKDKVNNKKKDKVDNKEEKNIKVKRINNSKVKEKNKSKKSKSTNKSSKEEIINLNDSQLDSKEYDYQQIIMNYDINNNKSVNVLTQYEISVIIGKRASQIAMGALPLIKVTSNMNHIEIAEEELRQKKTPFIIKREIGERAEYWKIEDLELSDVI